MRYLRLFQWRLIHHGPRRDVTIPTANGLLTCDSRDWLVGKYLFVNREYEIYYIRKTIEALTALGLLGETNGTLLDVGANIGMICIPLVRDGRFERAIAFEPDPNNFRLLERNVAQNELEERISVRALALSSEPGRAELELSPDNYGDHRVRRSEKPGFYDEQRRPTRLVQVETLDRVMAGEAPPALVWLDIQGHEGHFFAGARETLARGGPVVAEFWPYGIARSGMSRPQYCETVSSIFTDFYTFEGEAVVRHPIAELSRQFDLYDGPRRVGQFIFVRHGEGS